MLLKDNSTINLSLDKNNSWITKNKSNPLKLGDVIFIEKINENYEIKQIPKINGGLVAIDPFTGKAPVLERIEYGNLWKDINQFWRKYLTRIEKKNSQINEIGLFKLLGLFIFEENRPIFPF